MMTKDAKSELLKKYKSKSWKFFTLPDQAYSISELLTSLNAFCCSHRIYLRCRMQFSWKFVWELDLFSGIAIFVS